MLPAGRVSAASMKPLVILSNVKKKASQAATKKLADDNNAIQTTMTAVDDTINGTAKLTRLKVWITRSRAVLTRQGRWCHY